MFDQLLQSVKEHFSEHPELTEAIPAENTEDVHKEIASHLNDHLQNQSPSEGGTGGFLGKLEDSLGSGGMVTNAIGGGLVSSLASKFGLPPLITGAIAASLPAIIQKYLHRNSTSQGTNVA